MRRYDPFFENGDGMAVLKIPYGSLEKPGAYLELEVPDRNLKAKIIPREPKGIEDLSHAVEKAVETPIDGPRFSELFDNTKRVTFITENQFRQAPARDILPVLVQKARKWDPEISIIIGNATLPPLSKEELEKKLGPELIESGIPIFFNDADDFKQYRYIGITRAGTPLFVHKVVADADIVVTISTTQATVWGYGGSGMIIPAVTSSETTELNHLLSLAPDCIPGNNNCLMQLDKYEALELPNVQVMGINVIVNNQGRVIFVNAGTPVKSNREAIHFYNQIYQFPLDRIVQQKVDVAITGSTAHTDDLFFHTGWALVNCEPIVRDQGIIIMATPCTGYGDWPGFVRMDILKRYLPASKEKQVQAVLDFYRQTVSGERSFAWYKIYEVMTRKEVWIVTERKNLPICEEIGLTAHESIEEAFSQAVKKKGKDASFAFIPYGRYTLFKPKTVKIRPHSLK